MKNLVIRSTLYLPWYITTFMDRVRTLTEQADPCTNVGFNQTIAFG